MKERPILMSAPMVSGLLAGTKTQTRRVVKARADRDMGPRCVLRPHELAGEVNGGNYRNSPYGQPGDRLWVRETWQAFERGYDVYVYIPRKRPADSGLLYAADGVDTMGFWRPSIHMPRWASRITLEITGVRVERLQEISEADAIAEGVEWFRSSGVECPGAAETPIAAYRVLWEQINGLGSWDANPLVWVIEFKREAGNA